MNDIKKHSKIALSYFLIIAILGFLLRLDSSNDILSNYRYIVHTHSHIALLGWVYTALMTIIYNLYLHKTEAANKYKRIFIFTQLSIIGMLVTFPMEGYGFFSILFSTLFLIASYAFLWLFIKHTSKEEKLSNAYKLIRVGLWYMVVSSIGPWALGIIMSTLGSSSSWYRNAIYFFLHFQYNGWFILSLCGFFFTLLERRSISISKKKFTQFYYLLNLGVLLTFFLSILWMKPYFLFYILAGVGGIFQLLAFAIISVSLKQVKFSFLSDVPSQSRLLFKAAALFFVVKLIIQLGSAIPQIAHQASTNIYFVIGYLHWVFLGVVSVSILGFLNFFNWIKLSKFSVKMFLFGFVITEILILYRGTSLWFDIPTIEHYEIWILAASGILMGSIGILFINQYRTNLN